MTDTAAQEEAERYFDSLPTPQDGWGDWDITAAFIARAEAAEAERDRMAEALREIVSKPVPVVNNDVLYESASAMWHLARRALAAQGGEGKGE